MDFRSLSKGQERNSNESVTSSISKASLQYQIMEQSTSSPHLYNAWIVAPTLETMPQELLDMVAEQLSLSDMTRLSATSTTMQSALSTTLLDRTQYLAAQYKHCDPHGDSSCDCDSPHPWWNIELLLALARGDVDPSMIQSLTYIPYPRDDLESRCPAGTRGNIFRIRPSITLAERAQIRKLISSIVWIPAHQIQNYVSRLCDGEDAFILEVLLYLLTELRCLQISNMYDEDGDEGAGYVLHALQVVRETCSRGQDAELLSQQSPRPLEKLTLLNCHNLSYKTVLENIQGINLRFLVLDSCYDSDGTFWECPLLQSHVEEVIVYPEGPDMFENDLYMFRDDLRQLASHFQTPVTFRKFCDRENIRSLAVDELVEDDWTYCHITAEEAHLNFDFGHTCDSADCHGDIAVCQISDDVLGCYHRTGIMLEAPYMTVDAILLAEEDDIFVCRFCDVWQILKSSESSID